MAAGNGGNAAGGSDTPNTLRALREEHENIARLLDVLDREIAVFDRAERPDYEILQAIADYFVGFPDACHHPKEDVVFRKLKERDPPAARRIGDLEEEHQEAARRARRFAETLEHIVGDLEIHRGSFHGVAADFADFQRRHMRMEEETRVTVISTAKYQDTVRVVRVIQGRRSVGSPADQKG